MDAGQQRPRIVESPAQSFCFRRDAYLSHRSRQFQSFPVRNAIFRMDIGASIGKPFGRDRIVDREE
jgi:hypothetical protein